MMTRRRALLAGALVLSFGLNGCGWAPLYADPASGPADAELRAIRVAAIPERIGQHLATALRESLNPAGAATPQRYLLRVMLEISRVDLGVITQGSGTRGRLEVVARFTLSDSTSGAQLYAATSHIAESFDILANYYSNVVAEESARNRAVDELRHDIVTQLTLFLQRRAAPPAGRP